VKIAYAKPIAFRPETLRVVEQVNEIISDYAAQNLRLTLRQLYYRLVAARLRPNNLRSYKNLGTIVKNGRMTGLIDWDFIEDRNRDLHALPTWGRPHEIVADAATSYREDLWATQNVRVDVWSEKRALAGILEDVCDRLRVPFMAVVGYDSTSAMREAAIRIQRWEENGQPAVVLYFGDHDPSGEDMVRDIRDRLRTFRCRRFEVVKVALTRDQVEAYSLPANPAKRSDSRFEAYSEKHGAESWELDALEPATLTALVEEHVLAHRDDDAWQVAIAAEEDRRASLVSAASCWDAVTTYLAGGAA
jgi:hypothetical protein